MKNKFNIRGENTAIYVSYQEGFLECLIDTKSLERLHEFDGTFRAVWNEYTKSFYVMGYDRSYVPKRNTMIHRYLTGADETMVVDHFNHDTLDNRLSNLRVVTQSENMLNRDPSKESFKKITGVSWYENKNKWRAKVFKGGISSHIGYFEAYEDAVKAVIDFKSK